MFFALLSSTPLLPSIRIPLQTHALDRLFGPDQFCALQNFLDASLVADLAADVDSLRERLTPAAA